MTTYRFSVEIDSTNKPDALRTELRRICELTFPEVRVHRMITSSKGPCLECADTGWRDDWEHGPGFKRTCKCIQGHTVTGKITVDVTRAWPELTKLKRKLELGYSPTID